LLESHTQPFERFLNHCARWWAIAPKRYPRGVFKFRNIEEAREARQKHSTLNVAKVTPKVSVSPA